MQITKIVSGGQTGVDRAALDVALELGIPCGGWCPQGRKAEDGRIPDQYPLEETTSADFPVRTALNVHDSDGTLVITRGKPSRGTVLTVRLAQQYNKPCLTVNLLAGYDAAAIRQWIARNAIGVLNVAGSRESKHPGIHRQAVELLKTALNNE